MPIFNPKSKNIPQIYPFIPLRNWDREREERRELKDILFVEWIIDEKTQNSRRINKGHVGHTNNIIYVSQKESEKKCKRLKE